MIHLHTDIEILKECKDKFGNTPFVSNQYGYFMQENRIVKIVYSVQQAEDFLKNYNGNKMPAVYFYEENE